ncbi:Membrane transport protein [Dillenia turbinata]|uniref:Membrane transport protein n=1 Tax=Dillenia turbinata TaxID=194707 RepID=A0AAN8VZZ3_9MAGN
MASSLDQMNLLNKGFLLNPVFGLMDFLKVYFDCRDGAIPVLSLIVGANLLKGLRGSGIRMSIIVGIIVARYIVLPLIGVFVVKGALYFGWVQSNPLYQFVLLLQFAVPPAMNIGTITQLFGAGESECSVIMLWTYALASVSLTVWSTFFMWLVST